MLDIPYLQMTLAVFAVAVACVSFQRFFRKYVEPDQYYYLKDITIIGAWSLFGIWTHNTPLRITIAAAVIAGCIGFCQKVMNARSLRLLYFLTGLAFSVFGPRVAFIEAASGEYIYLSNIPSIIASTIWVGFMPIFFQDVDEIPGMCGFMLTAMWGVISAVIITEPKQFQDVTQICITGIVFLLVFRSRHLYAYRRLTEPLSAFWGTLVAGVCVFAVSRGIATWPLISAVTGFILIPVIEIVILVASAIFMPHPSGTFMLYKECISHGIDHSGAVYGFILLCTLASCAAAGIMMQYHAFIIVLAVVFVIFAITAVFFKLKKTEHKETDRTPALWGITIDNVSLNYALGKVTHWIETERTAHIIITPDALAALRSRKDARYRAVCEKASLRLPDGAGLISAFKLLGNPIQERLPGCEFVEHLCERAASEGWKVYFFGGSPGIAEAAAEKMKEKFSGLQVAGCRNGYFKEDEIPVICSEIKKSGADILFTGLGVPKQEYWLYEYLEKTGAVVGIGIGGSMDVISGKLKRASKIWQKMKLEWLYRTIQEPWRWKRLLGLPVFVWYVLLTKFHLDRYDKIN